EALFGPESEAEPDTEGAGHDGGHSPKPPPQALHDGGRHRASGARRSAEEDDRAGRPRGRAPAEEDARETTRPGAQRTAEARAKDEERFQREVDEELSALKRKLGGR